MGKAVGRVKTVLVSGEGSAVVTTLIATKVDKPDHDRLVFSGTVKFTDAVKNHLTSIILPHVENILNSLKMPYHSYEISVVNPGAVSSSDMITEVSGFSVDSSVFLALLSIELDIPIRQNLSFTGHISSKAGDISPVSSMEAKCDAVIEDQKITEFLFPDPDKDASYKKLKPDEYGSTVASIKSLNGRVKYSSIKNTFELLQNTLGPASIVLSSLKYGYFDGHIDDDHQISGYLKSHNKDRFWTTLEDCLAEKEVENFHTLLAEFSKFHIHRKKYPESLGADLYRLILSMPKHIRSIEGLFPLLPMDSYIRLIQNVAEKDHEDVSFLHDALFDRIERGKIVSQFNPEKSKKAKPESLLQQIIDQINPAHIDSEITRQIDIGRSTFISDRITVDSNREFIDVLTSFYIHMSRHTKTISGKVDKSAMEADALSLSEKEV